MKESPGLDRSGSGTWSMGAEVNLVFSSLKAASAAGDHRNGALGDVSMVSGADRENRSPLGGEAPGCRSMEES